MKVNNGNAHYITEAADQALTLALFVAANCNENNAVAQLSHDIINQSTQIISYDPRRQYLDPSRAIIIEWVNDRQR